MEQTKITEGYRSTEDHENCNHWRGGKEVFVLAGALLGYGERVRS